MRRARIDNWLLTCRWLPWNWRVVQWLAQKETRDD
jgi:hypothetical protein